MKPVAEKSVLFPLVTLTHRRWNIPVLAELERSKGAKFVTLAQALGTSRSALSASLADLMDLGLVTRNSGYGHPMRPEYLLTDRGRAVASPCLALTQLVQRRGEAELAFRKWTLPLVAAIGGEVRRFSEVRNTLGEAATPRAVTLGLKSILASGWARRRLIDEYPPTAGYALMPRGRAVLAQLEVMGSE